MSRSAPKTLVSGLLLDEVILELSDNYLRGQDILFSDAREALNREIADMWT
jgi:hypothetical protein